MSRKMIITLVIVVVIALLLCLTKDYFIPYIIKMHDSAFDR